MASFLTQCPGCMTSFRVTDTQLEAAEGMVRCGACLSVFSAPANRITLRKPLDPTRLPVLEPDAELENELDAAGYDLVPAEPQEDDDADEHDADTAAPQDESSDESSDESADDDRTSGLWFGDYRDRDVALGDLDLDLRAYEDEDEADDGEEDEDDGDEYEYEDDNPFGDEEDDDALIDIEDELVDDEHQAFIDAESAPDEAPGDEEDEAAEQSEPEFRVVEEYVQEPMRVDEAGYDSDFDRYDDHDADERDYAEDEDDDDDDSFRRHAAAASLHVPGRNAREPADKRELREYLAALEDDDALEPLDDYDLDALSEPVTINARHTVRRTLRFMSLFALNLVLISLLTLQYVNANLATLSASQRLAPLMSRVCRVLECPPPEQSDLGSLSSQDLLVRSHPRYAGALEVSFIFRNDAPDAQPFPAIELGFSDAANQLIANRLFQPADYLPPELQHLPAMPGQQTLQITLELADPGSEAVNYSIGFRAP